jgi:hypothetical protein
VVQVRGLTGDEVVDRGDMHAKVQQPLTQVGTKEAGCAEDYGPCAIEVVEIHAARS